MRIRGERRRQHCAVEHGYRNADAERVAVTDGLTSAHVFADAYGLTDTHGLTGADRIAIAFSIAYGLTDRATVCVRRSAVPDVSIAICGAHDHCGSARTSLRYGDQRAAGKAHLQR